MERIAKETWDLIQAQVFAIKMRGIGLEQSKKILENDNIIIYLYDTPFYIRSNRCEKLQKII